MPTSPVVCLLNVHKYYATDSERVRAVRGISIVIGRGEFIAIMGASGSGKSTLMNILGCLDRPTEGKYFLNGINAGAITHDERARLRNRKLGFVFQAFNLLPRTTVLENVELPMICGGQRVPPKEVRERARWCLERVGLASRADHFPNQISGGQQQRAAIARALANDPELLLADEPTGSLDTQTSLEIMGLFREINDGGTTVVMVTHEPDIARCSKRILLMKDGMLVSDKVVDDRINPLTAR